MEQTSNLCPENHQAYLSHLRAVFNARHISADILGRPNDHVSIHIKQDLELINDLLDSTHYRDFESAVLSALAAHEIHPIYALKVEDLVQDRIFHVQFTNLKVTKERFSAHDIKLLRWLLVSYSGHKPWNKLALQIKEMIQLLANLVTNDRVKAIDSEKLWKWEDHLEYYLFMLLENSYFDAIGGPLLPADTNALRRNLVLAYNSGYTTFISKKEAEHVIVHPYDLLLQIEQVLIHLRAAECYISREDIHHRHLAAKHHHLHKAIADSTGSWAGEKSEVIKPGHLNNADIHDLMQHLPGPLQDVTPGKAWELHDHRAEEWRTVLQSLRTAFAVLSHYKHLHIDLTTDTETYHTAGSDTASHVGHHSHHHHGHLQHKYSHADLASETETYDTGDSDITSHIAHHCHRAHLHHKQSHADFSTSHNSGNKHYQHLHHPYERHHLRNADSQTATSRSSDNDYHQHSHDPHAHNQLQHEESQTLTDYTDSEAEIETVGSDNACHVCHHLEHTAPSHGSVYDHPNAPHQLKHRSHTATDDTVSAAASETEDGLDNICHVCHHHGDSKPEHEESHTATDYTISDLASETETAGSDNICQVCHHLEHQTIPCTALSEPHRHTCPQTHHPSNAITDHTLAPLASTETENCRVCLRNHDHSSASGQTAADKDKVFLRTSSSELIRQEMEQEWLRPRKTGISRMA